MSRPFMWMIILATGVGFWIGIFTAPLSTLMIGMVLLLVEAAILLAFRILDGIFDEKPSPHETTNRITLTNNK